MKKILMLGALCTALSGCVTPIKEPKKIEISESKRAVNITYKITDSTTYTVTCGYDGEYPFKTSYTVRSDSPYNLIGPDYYPMKQSIEITDKNTGKTYSVRGVFLNAIDECEKLPTIVANQKKREADVKEKQKLEQKRQYEKSPEGKKAKALENKADKRCKAIAKSKLGHYLYAKGSINGYCVVVDAYGREAIFKIDL